VVLSGLEEHAVAGANHLDLSAAALAEAHPLGNVYGLAVGVGVPGGAGAGGEVYATGRKTGRLQRRGDGVDVDRAGEPLVGPEVVSMVFLVIRMSSSSRRSFGSSVRD
jgi:hypothetical protein